MPYSLELLVISSLKNNQLQDLVSYEILRGQIMAQESKQTANEQPKKLLQPQQKEIKKTNEAGPLPKKFNPTPFSMENKLE